jgi:hypothetical protein
MITLELSLALLAAVVSTTLAVFYAMRLRTTLRNDANHAKVLAAAAMAIRMARSQDREEKCLANETLRIIAMNEYLLWKRSVSGRAAHEIETMRASSNSSWQLFVQAHDEFDIVLTAAR